MEQITTILEQHTIQNKNTLEAIKILDIKIKELQKIQYNNFKLFIVYGLCIAYLLFK